MSELVDRAKASLEDTKCTDEMQDLFRVGLVRELIAEIERLERVNERWGVWWERHSCDGRPI
ncbi:hypothetical protein D2E71_15920 [Mycobacteroides abscessus]|nr:hypothetical protein D2E38_07365 [Mycobacteroides abscessus]RIR38569.1 hypothetical protein D2E36_17085 [Mycobacteroides abscessus]RIS43074.1 hypothetical protein D2E71_15920 [Mycobacteroides abscessus]RIT01325.1 hypothetical protein D2E72_24615 [Mycobacteroides abscessus]RIT20958.1 hypothetical protein D2E81_15825 [Mycobacteroides abscessus]